MPNELTNPNNVVTEERLAQFYQQILPYLGGMPDALANKFSKADLYSTDEKLIGRWIDGKPLYQKTIVNTTPLSGSSLHIDLSSDNADFIRPLYIAMAATSGDSAISYTPLNFNNSSSYVFYINEIGNHDIAIAFSANLASNRGNHGYIAILQYTKITDSAVEIGSNTDYSTTEKIVGTWINGKPIWQKTLEFVPNAHEYSYNISSLSVETPISVNGIAILVDNTPVTLDYITPVDIRYGIGIGASPTAILVNIGNQRSIPSKVIATIQYTKTSS